MALETGSYEQRSEKRVTVWKAPDKDGDGDPVWDDQKTADGQIMGRMRRKDKDGNEVNSYEPPEGFVNNPGFDHSDNYVRVDNKGRVVRDVNGNAIGIKPGHVLVENPDGTSELLSDEYGQYLFENAHDKVGGKTTPRKSTGAAKTEESK